MTPTDDRISTRRLPGDVEVLLLVICGANGTVDLVMPLDEIIDSYTTSSVVAATKMKFVPATINGKRVPTYLKFSFGFSKR